MSVKLLCPNCEAVLRPKAEVPAGANVRCPRCKAEFAARPVRLAAAAPPPAPATVATPAPDIIPLAKDDEDDATGYKVRDVEETEESKAEKKKVAYGSLRNKYPKGKRGPAVAKCVLPSNFLLREGVAHCVTSVAYSVFAIWPFIFSQEPLSADDSRTRWLMLGLGLLNFAWGAVVVLGTGKMHDLESYAWSMAGCIMAMFQEPLKVLMIYIRFPSLFEDSLFQFCCILAGTVGVALAIWGIVTLRNEVVIAGFEETARMAGKRPGQGYIDDEPKDQDNRDDDDEEDDD